MTSSNRSRSAPLKVKARAYNRSCWEHMRMMRKIPFLVRKHGLDRRKVYTVGFFNELAVDAKATEAHELCDHQGCKDCGYTGKIIHRWPEPIDLPEIGWIQLSPPPSYPQLEFEKDPTP